MSTRMRVTENVRWIGLALIALACGGQEQEAVVETPQTTTALARVGAVEIGVDRYERYLERIPEMMRGTLEPSRYLEALVEDELLVQEAEARSLHRNPQVQAAAERERIVLLQRLLYERAGIGAKPPVEDSLRAYFARSPYNRKVRFSLLMVRDSTVAVSLLAQLRKGADFEKLSMRHSQDPRILERSADMGYHRWGETMPAYVALTKKAFSMEVGQLAGPLKVADGYFLIKLKDVHPVSFEQEHETVEKLVKREEVGRQLLAYYDSLHLRYKVRYNEPGVEALRAALGDGGTIADPQMSVVSYDGGPLKLARAQEMMRGVRGEKSEQMRQALHREFARQILASLEVVRLGLVDDKDVSAGVERARRQELVRRLKEQLLAQAPPPNINALRLFYQDYGERYTEPPKVEVDRLLTSNPDEGRTIVERLRGGEELVDDRFVHLIYGSGAWQGDNPVSRALRAEVGTVHGPFATDNGYIVVRITARRDSRQPKLEEVQEQVEADWLEDQSQKVLKDFAEGLRKRRAAEILINQDQLQRLSH
ncbi:MAG: peptidyl-prolyl cis-trans isomerase [Candidatus Latescibacterota bacterium]